MRRTYIQDPTTHKFVLKEDYYPPVQRTHLVTPDITPFVSVVDGKVIGSRSHLNDHNQRNDVVCAGDYKAKDYIDMAHNKRQEMQGQTKADKADRIDILKHLCEQARIH